MHKGFVGPHGAGMPSETEFACVVDTFLDEIPLLLQPNVAKHNVNRIIRIVDFFMSTMLSP